VDRYEYVRAIRPHCSTKYAAIGWIVDEKIIVGWIYEEDDHSVSRAIDAYLDGNLHNVRLKHRVRADGKPKDTGTGIALLGLIPVNDEGEVHLLVFDFDRKGKDAKPISEAEIRGISDWMHVKTPIAFHSKSGTGAHMTVFLKNPTAVPQVTTFSKSWGFNIGGKPHQHPLLQHTEIFPKTGKKSMLWLPGEDEDPDLDEPRPHALICGTTVEEATSERSALIPLPFANGERLGKHLDIQEMNFLLGLEREAGNRNETLNRVTSFLCVHGMDCQDAGNVIRNAARASGLLDEEHEKTKDTFQRAWTDTIEKKRAEGVTIGAGKDGLPKVGKGEGETRTGGKKKKEPKVKLHMAVINEMIGSENGKATKHQFGRSGYLATELYYYEDDLDNKGLLLMEPDEMDKKVWDAHRYSIPSNHGGDLDRQRQRRKVSRATLR